jgi:hypothetical protein
MSDEPEIDLDDIDGQVWFTAGWVLDAPAWVPPADVEQEKAYQSKVAERLAADAA